MDSILVTGGAGYIGSHTAKALAAAGYDPVTFDNLSAGHRWAVKWGNFVEGDLHDFELLRETIHTFRISAVLHFAAFAYVGESVAHPQRYFDNNVGNALTLLRAMLATGVRRIVFSSTCATYGIPAALPITEQTPQCPVNPYGESKLMVEKILRWHADAYGLRSVCLRYFNASGADPEGEIGESHDPETHLIPLVIQTAMGMRPFVQVYGADYATADGTAIRDYVHVSDLADAHVRALRYLDKGRGSAVFNLGVGSGFSVRDVIRAVERASGRHVPARVKRRRPGDPPALIAHAARAAEELKWRPRFTNLDEIVGTAWKWHTSRTARAAGAGHKQ